MEDVVELKHQVLSLRHHISGNGGKGILQRINDVEQKMDFFEGNFVDKGVCLQNRTTDFSANDRQYQEVLSKIEEFRQERRDDKTNKIMLWGILTSALLSLASLIMKTGVVP